MPRPATRYCFGRIPGSEGGCSVYQKVMDGEAWTHAVVSAAVVIEMDSGACRKARIVPGGVAPIPWRVPAAERLRSRDRRGQPAAKKQIQSTADTRDCGARHWAGSGDSIAGPILRRVVDQHKTVGGSMIGPPGLAIWLHTRKGSAYVTL